MKDLLKCGLFPVVNVFANCFRIDYKKCYAQSGEDMILNTILCDVKKGFYVDVGANNPVVASNTHFFYRKKWSGINIDAMPRSMHIFNKKRKKDINIEVPISDEPSELTFYMFSQSSYNSFLKEAAVLHKDKLIKTEKLYTQKLSDVLFKYNVKDIDFLSVDVEGFDLKVLKSNNWEKYRPKVIVVEHFAYESNPEISEIGQYLTKKNYKYYCNTSTNAFFLEKTFLKSRYPLQKII